MSAVALLFAGNALASPSLHCNGLDSCYAPQPNSGVIDVTAYGARGDGIADDTPAIRAALAAADEKGGVWPPIVYLPPGVYKVTGTIEKRDAKGDYDSGFLMRGAGSEHTVIRLTDGTPGFQNPDEPRAVLFTSSHLWGQGGPYAGGKDWPGKGEGNQAFQNSIEGITIDVGAGNPGAIALDYLANNACALRDVTLRDIHGAASTGLLMTRKWPGPCLVERLRVQGFEVGIDVSQTTYSLTMLDVVLDGPRRVGLRNNGNILSIADFRGTFPLVAVENASVDGVVLLASASLDASDDSAIAFRNRGILRVSGLHAEGFSSVGLNPLPGPTEDAIFEGAQQLAVSETALQVPAIPPAPEVPDDDWVSVAAFGATPSDDKDDTRAIQEAFDSGAAGIYLPFGIYDVLGTLRPSSTTRWIAGMNSQIRALVRDEDTPVLATGANDDSLLVDNLRFAFAPLKERGSPGTWIRHDGPGTLVLRNIFENALGYPSTALHRSLGGGKAVLANVCCGRLVLDGPAPVVAYHFNSEGTGTRILNRGADLLVLGIKTEGAAEVARTEAGGRTEILGGLLYPVRPVPPDLAAFVIVEGSMRATFSDRSFRIDQSYATLVASGDGRGIVPGCRTRSIMLGTRWFRPDDLAAPSEATCR